MGDVGSVRRHKDGRYYLDFGRSGRIWSLRVGDSTVPFDERLAGRTLERIRGRLAENVTLEEAIAQFLPERAKPNLISSRLTRWLELKEAEVEAGDRSPTYLRTLKHYAKPKGVMSWWDGLSIYDIDYGALEDWSHWLAKRGLSPKSRKNILGVFRSFLGWLYKRGDLRAMPRDFPWPKVPEHQPQILSPETQMAVVQAIPEEKRGIFLCMSLLGLRNGEARALDAADYRDGYLTVGASMKGPERDAPRRAPKNNRWRRLPVPDDLAAWIAEHVPREATLQRRPLFVHPSTNKRWAPTAMKREWHQACDRVGIPRGKLYEGARHTAGTKWRAQGTSLDVIGAILGHADSRSTKRYARLADRAVEEALRPDVARTWRGARVALHNHLN